MADTTTRTMGGTAPWLTTRVAGLCGLLFVAIVVVQNVLRGAVAPAADAEVSEIIEFATDDRAVIQVLVAMFAVAIVIMTVFVAGLYRHVADGLERIAARVGLIGWVGVAAMFGTVVVSEMSLAVAGEHLADSPGLARAFWTLNNTAFALNMAMLATALLGFSLAGAAAGSAMVPPPRPSGRHPHDRFRGERRIDRRGKPHRLRRPHRFPDLVALRCHDWSRDDPTRPAISLTHWTLGPQATLPAWRRSPVPGSRCGCPRSAGPPVAMRSSGVHVGWRLWPLDSEP